MAKRGLKVLDSDMHVFEPPDMWQRYMPKELRARAPRCKTNEPRDFSMEFEGQTIPLPSLHGSAASTKARQAAEKAQERQYAQSIKRSWDAASQVKAMDKEGIDVAVLYPSRGLIPLGMDGLDPKLAAAVSSAYNDWLYEFCQGAPDRMFGAAMIAVHDIRSAVKELERAVAKFGFRGAFLRPNFINGRNWHDPYYYPLWNAFQDLNVPLGFHEGGAVPANQVGKDLKSEALHHVVSHPVEMMLSMVSMIGGGVLERFPRLRVAFLEANCSWVPWLLWRLDETLEPGTWAGLQHPDLRLKPSAYFGRQCYVSVESDEEPALNALQLLGKENVVFSTDYPHLDSKYPHSVDRFLELPFNKATQRKLLWDNCARFYGL